MLSVGPGSSCDVCFERFGHDHKAPCSISCGHVFCSDCISHIRSCPLCRTPFDSSSCIRLHVDVDTIPPEQTVGCSSDVVKEAQRLHQAISSIADVGIDEQGLRQLIQEAKNFLHGQPRHLFRDLRVAHRMIAYLCELKTSFRTQKQMNDGLNDQIQQLSAEKAELLKKLQGSEETRMYERDTALAVEKSLREHNALAVRNYHVLIQVYNKLVQWTTELLKNPSLPPYSAATAEEDSNVVDGILQAPVTNFLPAANMKALEGVAIGDSESGFLISPLPQFTNVLPSILDGITPLPELTEDIEGEEKSDEDEEISTPDNSQNDRPIEAHQEIKMQPNGELIPTQRSAFEASVLSRPSSYQRARSQSIPSRSHSIPSRSPSPSLPPSIRSVSASPPKSSPYHLPSSSPVQSSLYPHSTRDSYSSSTRATNGDVLRTRLHDLLRDSSTPLPSAPPSQSLSTGEREDNTTATSPPPFRTGTSDSNRAYTAQHSRHSSGDGIAHLLASGSHQQSSNKPAPTPSPNPFGGQRYSSASTEAKKLEEERRRKHQEEKQQRQKERHRQRDEWHREERNRDERHNHHQDFERPLADADREYSTKVSSSTTTTTTMTVSRRDQSAAANQNHVYNANPLISNPVSSLNRRSSIGNAYNQQTTIPASANHEHPSVHHGRYTTAPAGNKLRPTPIPSNPANIYA